MTLGIVILNYKDFAETTRLVREIENYPDIDHIVIVDNHSENGSYEALLPLASEKISIIATKENGGYARGNNAGIRFLKEHYDVELVGISNPDVSFSEEFPRKIKSLFAKNPDYAVIAGVTYRDGKPSSYSFWKDSAWIELTQLGASGLPKFIWKHLRKRFRHEAGYVEKKLAEHSRLFPVENVVGSLFFVRMEPMDMVGGVRFRYFLIHGGGYSCAKIASARLEIRRRAYTSLCTQERRIGGSSF